MHTDAKVYACLTVPRRSIQGFAQRVMHAYDVAPQHSLERRTHEDGPAVNRQRRCTTKCDAGAGTVPKCIERGAHGLLGERDDTVSARERETLRCHVRNHRPRKRLVVVDGSVDLRVGQARAVLAGLDTLAA